MASGEKVERNDARVLDRKNYIELSIFKKQTKGKIIKIFFFISFFFGTLQE